jgi:methionyl-tRNA formyltransferase
MMDSEQKHNLKFHPDDLRLIFMGTPDFSVPVLANLIRNGFIISGVVTQPDRAAGRKLRLIFPPVKELAMQYSIPVVQPDSMRDKDFCDVLKSMKPDVIVTCAYGKILPAKILAIPRFGCINVHASLLPKYRGAAPIQWCLINGETETGITYIEMDEGMDTGPALDSFKIDIPSDINAGELSARLSDIGAKHLPSLILRYCNGDIKPKKQKEENAFFVRPICKEDAKIDWSQDALSVYNRIRGLNPCPGAFTYYKNKRMKICIAKISQDFSMVLPINQSQLRPGSIVRTQDKSRLFIMCKDIPLEIIGLQMEGCKRMKGSECAHNFDLREIAGGA